MSFGFDESRVSMGQQMYRHDAILNTKNILSTRASEDFMDVCIMQMTYKRDIIKIGIGNLIHIPDFNLTLTLKTKSTWILKFISWFMISVYAIFMYKISGLAKLCIYGHYICILAKLCLHVYILNLLSTSWILSTSTLVKGKGIELKSNMYTFSFY